MAVPLSFLLILTGLTGVHGITTVSEVSVKAGDSITIPCLYDPKYRNNVKYLCEGYHWSFCKYQVQTNGHSSGKFSISDDKNQRIFTVTINNLRDTDTDYWCIVEITGGPDVGQYFHLSVSQGTPGLYVDHQEITGFNGDSVSVSCTSSISGNINWCRLDRICVTRPSGSIGGTNVTISARDHNAFTVTMSGLRAESSGWYYCAHGKLHVPVHVTVTERPTSTLTTGFSTTLTPTDQNLAVVGNSTFLLKVLVIPLSLLIFTVIVTLFIWFMLKKHKQIHTKTLTTARTSHAENDMDVTYSSVVTKKQPARKQVEAQDNDVTYSTLAQTHKNI